MAITPTVAPNLENCDTSHKGETDQKARIPPFWQGLCQADIASRGVKQPAHLSVPRTVTKQNNDDAVALHNRIPTLESGNSRRAYSDVSLKNGLGAYSFLAKSIWTWELAKAVGSGSTFYHNP